MEQAADEEGKAMPSLLARSRCYAMLSFALALASRSEGCRRLMIAHNKQSIILDRSYASNPLSSATIRRSFMR